MSSWVPEVAMKTGWTRVAFGDVVKLSRERSTDPEEDGFERYVGLDHIDPGDLKIRRWGSIADGTTFTSVFRPGHVLFGKRRAYQRKVALADFSGVCSGDIYVFEAKSSRVLPELLPFICQTGEFFDRAIGTSAGSLSPRTNWNSLASYEFALPPLEDQRSLAGVLVTADEVSESLLRLLESQRISEAALFDRLVARNRPTTVALGSLLTEPPRNGYSASERDEETGHWVLSLSAITKWGYRPGQIKAVERTPAMTAAVLEEGDLVISRSNTLDLVGLPAVFDEDRGDISRPDTMMRLKPDESRLRKRFLELFLRSPAGRRQVQSFAAGTSASMKKINGTNLVKVGVPLLDVAIQMDIEQRTEAIRQGGKLLDARRKQSQELRVALLQEMMSVGTGADK
jgi:type I restriction enzyme, S subunit